MPPMDDEGRRLPPGQHRTDKWPVLDLGTQPNIVPREWRLTVGGQVDRPLNWDWDDFQAQPRVTVTSDIHCVTSWSRLDNTWEGVAGRHLLELARPRPSAKFLIFHSHDGYTTNVPLEYFAAPDTLLADTWEGKPIGREHGGPVRPVVPKLYFWKSAKWLKHITVTDRDVPGYWEARGYHMLGDPWKEQRYG